MRFTLALIAIILSISSSSNAQYGGTASTSISGNIVRDISLSIKDSLISVLTTSGVSYTNPFTATASTSWFNYPTTSFSGVRLVSATISDSSLFIAGFNVLKEQIYGGKLFSINRLGSSFRAFDPSFKEGDDEFDMYPATISVGDSFVYVAFNKGAFMRNKRNPTTDSNWKLFLSHSPAYAQIEISNNLNLSKLLTKYYDSLQSYAGDTLSVIRFIATINSDTLFTTLHQHTCSFNALRDSATITWQKIFFSGDTFKKSTETYKSKIDSFDNVCIYIRDSIIPTSLQSLLRRNDTLQERLKSLATNINFNEYPPTGYQQTHYGINSITPYKNLLFLAKEDEWTISTDHGHTQIDGFCNNVKIPIFFKQSSYKFLINQKQQSDTFRVFAFGTKDTIAVSSWLPDASIDSVTRFPKHIDTLKKWTFIADGGVSDISVFRDTLIVGYSKDSQNGIRKYYEFDTLNTKVWRFKTVPLNGFLEPQLGTNVITAVPIDSVKYDLWAGTDEGLYHLKYGSTSWRHIEHKKTLASSNEAYAFPTVIYPGYKSTRFAYSLEKNSRVTIEVFDFSMRKVRTVTKDANRNAGERSDLSTEDRWDGRDDRGRAVSPGVYYFKISSDDGDKFGKIIVYGAKDAGMDP